MGLVLRNQVSVTFCMHQNFIMAARIARTRSSILLSPSFSNKIKSCLTSNAFLSEQCHRNFAVSTSLRASDHEVEQSDKPSRPRPSSGLKIEDIKRVQPKQFELSFQEYLKLKGSLRTRKNIAGLPFAVVGLGTSSVVSAYMFPEMFDATPENVQLIMGLDPLVFCGICGVFSAGIGFAAGTQLFRILWKLFNKDKALQLLEREKDFLERIQNKRFASFSKFEDDYYGESIKNLSDYRQWLRTQQKKASADEKFANQKKKDEENETQTA